MCSLSVLYNKCNMLLTITNCQRVLAGLCELLSVRKVSPLPILQAARDMDSITFIKQYASELAPHEETEIVLQDVTWNIDNKILLIFVGQERLRTLLDPIQAPMEVWIILDVEDKEMGVLRDLKHYSHLKIAILYSDDIKHNVLRHTEIPQCRIATPAEVRQLLSRFAIRKNQLPIIRTTDPVAKRLGAQKSMIVLAETMGGPGGIIQDPRQVVEDVEFVT